LSAFFAGLWQAVRRPSRWPSLPERVRPTGPQPRRRRRRGNAPRPLQLLSIHRRGRVYSWSAPEERAVPVPQSPLSPCGRGMGRGGDSPSPPVGEGWGEGR
jgi:hypothetical protein